MPVPFPSEFRQRAIELARTSDKPLAEVAAELGISRSCLQVAAEMDGSARNVVERLMALQVFDTHSDGSYSVEPRLLSAWQASLT